MSSLHISRGCSKVQCAAALLVDDTDVCLKSNEVTDTLFTAY